MKFIIKVHIYNRLKKQCQKPNYGDAVSPEESQQKSNYVQCENVFQTRVPHIDEVLLIRVHSFLVSTVHQSLINSGQSKFI